MDFTQDFTRSKEFLIDKTRDYQEKVKIVKDLFTSFQESFNKIDLNSNFLLEFKKSLDFQKDQQENKRKLKEMTLVNQKKYLESQKMNDEKLIKMQNDVLCLKRQIDKILDTKKEMLSVLALKELEIEERRSFFNECFQQETELNQAVESIRAKRQEILISKNTAITQKQESELRQLDLNASYFESNKDRNQRVTAQSSQFTNKKSLKIPIETLLTLLIILVSLLFFLS